MVITDDVIVNDSPIEGKGVFAAKDFAKNEIVLHWDLSKELSEEDYKKLNKVDN